MLNDKNQLRAFFKAKRLFLSKREVAFLSQKICENFINNLFTKIVDKAKIFSIYNPSQNEVETKLISQFFLQNNIEFCYPKIIAKDQPLRFIKANKNSKFEKNNLYPKILEIKNNEEIVPNCIILPLVAFDKNKSRLGMGGGFFDRTLDDFAKRNIETTTIALAFNFQLSSQLLPKEKHDKTIDYIITENSIIN